MVEVLKNRFKVSAGELTPDGMWSFEEVECLGSCGTAPMCQINDRFFENLTTDRLNEILDQIAEVKPDLRYSTIKEKLGEGLNKYPPSEVLK